VIDIVLAIFIYMLAPVIVVISVGFLSLKIGDWIQLSTEKAAKIFEKDISELEATMLRNSVEEIGPYQFRYNSKIEFSEAVQRHKTLHENAIQLEKIHPGLLEKVRKKVRSRKRLSALISLVIYVFITIVLMVGLFTFQRVFYENIELKSIEQELRAAEGGNLDSALVELRDKVSRLSETDSVAEMESLSRAIMLNAKEIEVSYEESEDRYLKFESKLLLQQQELNEVRETNAALKKLSDNESMLVRSFFLADAKSTAALYFWLGIIFSAFMQIFILLSKKPFSKIFFRTSIGQRLSAMYDIDGSST